MNLASQGTVFGQEAGRIQWVNIGALSGRCTLPRVGLRGNRTPLTLGDPGAVNPDALCSLLRTAFPHLVFQGRAHTRTHTHTHKPYYFMVLTGPYA